MGVAAAHPATGPARRGAAPREADRPPAAAGGELALEPRCWPAGRAAAYIGLSVGMFERCAEAGILPRGIRFGSRVRVWDRVALDRAIDRLSGVGRGAGVAQDADNEDLETPLRAAIRRRGAERGAARSAKRGRATALRHQADER